MPSTKRQRELARRRAERQAIRRAELRRQRRRRNRILYASTFAVVLLIVGGVFALPKIFDDEAKPTPAANSSACGGAQPAPPTSAGLRTKEPPMTVDKKAKYTMTLKTSCGDLFFELFDDKAPRTVNSLKFLASTKFYDGTSCHRMGNKPGFAFLQCGDPTGTGSGEAPGYRLPEENLAGAKYPRGALAMANTGQPNSSGSQFFLMTGDSDFPPSYTLVGRVLGGQEVLDKLAAVGDDGSFEPDPGGGKPKQKVFIETLRVAKA